MKKRKRLLWQLYPSYLLITLISLMAVSWYASTSLRKLFLDKTAADLIERVRLIENQVLASLRGGPDAVDRFCRNIHEETRTHITVILPSGKVAGDSNPAADRSAIRTDLPEIVTALSGNPATAIRYGNNPGRRTMHTAVPLMQHGEVRAVVRVSLPLTFVDQEVRQIQIRIAFGGLLIAWLAAVISLFISSRISKPIEEIKNGAERFAGGDLSHRLPSADSEEMNSLAEALNQMASQLDDRIKTVLRQRNELAAVLASMSEGILAVDREERIVSMNRAAGAIFNRPFDASKGRTLQEVIRNPDLQRFVSKTLETGEYLEEDIRMLEGGERILHTHATPLLDARQERFGILVVLNDVTQLRRLENMRRDFAANVSHEIKTPITAIKGFVETLQAGAVEQPEKAQRFLGIIERHVDRLTAIIDDLLKLSRIEQADETNALKLKPENVRKIAANAVQLCGTTAAGKGIRINLEGAGEAVARVDGPLLEQAMVNLIENAINYSAPDGPIRVVVAREEAQVCVHVIDKGIGIAREHIPRLFERFYRVDKARSRNMGGTGLGLAIVKHIVNTHGGRVSVESRPGLGSTFTIHLPAE